MTASTAARDITRAPPPGLDPLLDIPPECLPDYDNLITEDDAPVDNLYSEKQQRLLTESLYIAWPGPKESGKFLTTANVGLFFTDHDPALVPDVLLSLDVEAPKKDVGAKHNRSYFIWRYGKPPEVVIEIVSNRKGGEDTTKLKAYARLKIDYYVIYDPFASLSSEPLRIYALREGQYTRMVGDWLTEVGLGLTLWQGEFEDMEMTWLRWRDSERIIPTGKESVAREQQWAEAEHARAEEERARAEEERARAEEASRRAEEERARAEEERARAEEERARAEEASRRAEEERAKAEEANRRAEHLARQLRELGFEPEG